MTDYYIYGQMLTPVKNHPRAGIMLSNNLRWNSHIEIKVNKGSKSLVSVGPIYILTQRSQNAWFRLPLSDLIWSMPQQYGTLTDTPD